MHIKSSSTTIYSIHLVPITLPCFNWSSHPNCRMSITCIASFAGLMRTSQKPNGGVATMSSVRHLDGQILDRQMSNPNHFFHVQKTWVFGSWNSSFLKFQDLQDSEAYGKILKELECKHLYHEAAQSQQSAVCWSMWITKKHSETFSVSVSSIQMHPVLLPSEETPGLRTVVATPWLGHTLRLGNWTHNDSHWLQVKRRLPQVR